MGHFNRMSGSDGPVDAPDSLLPLHSAVVLLASVQACEAAAALSFAAGQNLACTALAAGSAFAASVPFFHKIVARRC
jgi:hypothetical protein